MIIIYDEMVTNKLAAKAPQARVRTSCFFLIYNNHESQLLAELSINTGGK